MFFLKLIGLLALALTLSSDGGGAMDPNGRPVTNAARCGDDGNGLDPHGQPCPRPSAARDAGSGIDPNG